MVYKLQYLRSMSWLHRAKGPHSHWDWTLLSKIGPGNVCGPHMVRGSVNRRSLKTLALRLEKCLFCPSYSIKSISSSVDHRLSDFKWFWVSCNLFTTLIKCLWSKSPHNGWSHSHQGNEKVSMENILGVAPPFISAFKVVPWMHFCLESR